MTTHGDITSQMIWKHFRTHKLTKYFEETNSFLLGYLLIFFVTLFIRLCVSVGEYSGYDTPPMFGDYEAQRHWMEITNNLPMRDWYEPTADNDLQYWGLDYPPLTAYHSWLCGKAASMLGVPQLIELHTSHGIETPDTKFYMRMTVVVSDILFFISAVFIFFSIAYPKQSWNVRSTAILCVLINPLFIIIDHGHFQYNCVSLGLTLWSINAMLTQHYYIGSVLFVLSICFKQMALFYAFPFFFYCIGIARQESRGQTLVFLYKIAKFGVVVVATFYVMFSPWIKLQRDQSALLQVVGRIFPFERGLFEDKVANVWGCTNIVVKWRELFGVQYTKIFALIATLIGCAPCLVLIRKPTPKYFLYSLSIAALSFFLFSFQVHEKNILYPLLPMSLFIVDAPYFIGALSWIAMFSMLPLIRKDGQLFMYLLLSLLWYLVTLWIQPLYSMQYATAKDRSPSPPMHPIVAAWRLKKHLSPDESDKSDDGIDGGGRDPRTHQRKHYPIDTLNGHSAPFHHMSLYWCYQPFISLFIFFMTNVQWTDKYPDIGTYLIMIYCCVHFGLAWIMFVFQLLLEYFGTFTPHHVLLCNKINAFCDDSKKQKTS